MAKRKALGKGLGALIPDINDNLETSEDRILLIDLEDIQPNPLQPRKNFDNNRIEDLAASIRERLKNLRASIRHDHDKTTASKRRQPYESSYRNSKSRPENRSV